LFDCIFATMKEVDDDGGRPGFDKRLVKEAFNLVGEHVERLLTAAGGAVGTIVGAPQLARLCDE
jgi:hypothetical protein